jgi:hypothetical protein
MFVRFRRQAKRLQISLVQNRRAHGRVQAEHIAALGSVDVALSVRERFAFWAKLPERLARLGNRVGPNDQEKFYAAINARVPLVKPGEQREIQAENAKDDERFWDAMMGISASNIEGHKRIIASSEAVVARETQAVNETAERIERARERLAKLARGEDVVGGLGKKLDIFAMTKAAGITPRMMKRMQTLAELSQTEFESLLKKTDAVKAVDNAFDCELRRLIRARARKRDAL